MPIRTLMLLMPVVMFGLFLISVVVSIFRNKNRKQQMAEEAQSLGFTFSHGSETLSAPKIATPFFLSGSAGFENAMAGSYAGMNVDVFDYSHTMGSASNTTVTVQTVAVYTQNIDFPTFALGPGGLAAKIIGALEHQNVDVTSDKEFLRHHSVCGNDKERVQALFSPSLIDFVKQLDRTKAWQIEGAANTLVIYRYAHQVKPAVLKDFLQETSSIAQSFFAYAYTTKSGAFSASSNR